MEAGSSAEVTNDGVPDFPFISCAGILKISNVLPVLRGHVILSRIWPR